jgi:hypothetical protein
LLFPTRVAAGAQKGQLAWGPLSLSRASNALHNPWYAGAYTYGRGRFRKQPDGRERHERLPQDQWHVLIRDAHPAYISWQEYERIEQQLRASTTAIGFDRNAGPPREGPALLQGRVVCGLCGSRMNVHYNTRRRGVLVTNYVCWGRGKLFGDPLCQSILGTAIDDAIGKLLVEAVTPMALELALAVQQEITVRLEEADRLRHRQVERAQYEADLARHRYMQVDSHPQRAWAAHRCRRRLRSNQRPVGPLLGKAQEPQGAAARGRNADQQAALRPARRLPQHPCPLAPGGPHQGSHLQRHRRVALLATGDEPAAPRSIVHAVRPNGHVHCRRCSMRSAPSRSTSSPAPSAAAG